MLKNTLDKLIAFRKSIHELIPVYRDATLDLIDALSTNKNAQSVTQLSDNPFFRRQYNSLTKVIHYFLVSNEEEETPGNPNKNTQPDGTAVGTDYRPNPLIQKAIVKQIVHLCPAPEQRNFFIRQ